MATFLVSGLANTETSVRVRGFPVPYYPVDYPFFGVETGISGVGVNVAKSLSALGNGVTLCSLVGDDAGGRWVKAELERAGIGTEFVRGTEGETAASAVLHDGAGRRQIHCDLKDLQERTYDFGIAPVEEADMVVACNINFSRPLLRRAIVLGKRVASDVHVLGNPDDAYNRDFMAAAEVLFLSDEGAGENPRGLMEALAARYGNRVIVMGRGGLGALMLHAGRFTEMPAWDAGRAENTVGAGDALFAAFLHHYARGMGVEEALDRAQLAAAMKIRRSGGGEGFPREAEWEAEWRAGRRQG